MLLLLLIEVMKMLLLELLLALQMVDNLEVASRHDIGPMIRARRGLVVVLAFRSGLLRAHLLGCPILAAPAARWFSRWRIVAGASRALICVVACGLSRAPSQPIGLLLLLFLLLFLLLIQMHLHVALLFVAPRKSPTTGITTERFLSRMSPLVGRQVVASAEGSRALLRARIRSIHSFEFVDRSIDERAQKGVVRLAACENDSKIGVERQWNLPRR